MSFSKYKKAEEVIFKYILLKETKFFDKHIIITLY